MERLQGAAAGASGRRPVPHMPDGPVAHVLSFLPVPDRLRCREVCRAWRSILAQPRLWRVLDLSPAKTAGCAYLRRGTFEPTRRRRFAGVLRAASEAARGGVEAIDIDGTAFVPRGVVAGQTEDRLLPLNQVIARNAATLRRVRFSTAGPLHGNPPPRGEDLIPSEAAALLALAPNLAELDVGSLAVSSSGNSRKLAQLLSGPRGAALRLRSVNFGYGCAAQAGENAPDWAAAAQTLGEARVALLGLRLVSVVDDSRADEPLPSAAATQFASAFRARELFVMLRDGAALSGSRAQLLVRLLRENPRLQRLEVKSASFFYNRVQPTAETEHFAELCAALRGSRLAELMLPGVPLRQTSAAPELAAVAEALRGHPTLRILILDWNGKGADAAGMAEAAAAIARLISANSPALRWLGANSNHLDLRGLTAVYAALRSNSHLESFSFIQRPAAAKPEGFDQRFAREHILPAVRACASLRSMNWDCPVDRETDRQICALFKERSRAVAAAAAAAAAAARRA